MVIHFTRRLTEALNNIEFHEEYHYLPLSFVEMPRTYSNSDEIVDEYGKLKWKIVDLFNEKFEGRLEHKFDLEHWLREENDELAYFLNEAGSNALNHSEFRFPCAFHVWLGKKGFVIAIEQKGKGFNVEEVERLNIKTNKGKAFAFFRNCKSNIFFDEPKDARIVFMEKLL